MSADQDHVMSRVRLVSEVVTAAPPKCSSVSFCIDCRGLQDFSRSEALQRVTQAIDWVELEEKLSIATHLERLVISFLTAENSVPPGDPIFSLYSVGRKLPEFVKRGEYVVLLCIGI